MGRVRKKIAIGVDQGTTGTTVLAVDEQLRIVAEWYRKHRQYRPQVGWLEHNPEEILEVVVEGIAGILERIGGEDDVEVTIGLANQGETVCCWDKATGKPLYNAIVWSDCRSEEIIDSLSEVEREKIRTITGLEPDSYFSASKIVWLLRNVAEVQSAFEDGRLMVGTLDSWCIWKLTGGKVYITDPSTASRTMLYDISANRWSEEILKMMGLDGLTLPDIKRTVGVIGYLSYPSWQNKPLMLSASIVDQPASLFAHRCWEKGQMKVTYGTGCFLLVNAGKVRRKDMISGLTNSVGWDIGEGAEYIIDGAVYSAGSVLEWLDKDCGWVKRADQIDKIVLSISDQEGLIFVPSMDGLSAPYWRRDVKGILAGLTLATKPAHIIRAALDGIAHQVADLVEILPKDIRDNLTEIKVDGGLSGSNYLMQKQADLIGLPIMVSENREMTAMGVAILAMIGAGWVSKDKIRSRLESFPYKTFTPKLTEDKRRAERARWKRAVKLAISSADVSG